MQKTLENAAQNGWTVLGEHPLFLQDLPVGGKQ